MLYVYTWYTKSRTVHNCLIIQHYILYKTTIYIKDLLHVSL